MTEPNNQLADLAELAIAKGAEAAERLQAATADLRPYQAMEFSPDLINDLGYVLNARRIMASEIAALRARQS